MTSLKKWATIQLPKTFIIALLFSFYTLSFVITPFWNLAPSIPTRFAILMVTLVAGVVWSFVSGSVLRIYLNIRAWAIFAILFALMIALNYRQLTYGIPWRGDEDFHITRTLYFVDQLILMNKWALAGFGAFTIFIILAWIRPRWAEYTGAFLIVGIVFYFLTKNPFGNASGGFIVRYPAIVTWFAAIVPTVAAKVGDPYYEVLYRIIPFIFAVALAWSFQHYLPISNTPARLLWGISIATIPLVFYYSSILYLELPAVFLMTVVCFQIKDLLEEDAAQVKSTVGWYCLIIIGFIKETSIPFLISFLAVRWLVQLLKKEQSGVIPRPRAGILNLQLKMPSISRVRKEASIAFSVLFPSFFYLVLRDFISTNRKFSFQWENLLVYKAYLAYVQSFIDQFGVFLLFFAAGYILLLKKKEYAKAGFLLIVFVGTVLFHLLDNWIYAGYSRFNLFLIPPLLLGASVTIEWMTRRKQWIGIAGACLAILISLVLSPINMDGSKRPFWDRYNIDTSEHYYPYREAISWLKETYPDEPVIVGGITYPYYFDFYKEKIHWKPGLVFLRADAMDNDAEALRQAIAEAQKYDYKIILFHVFNQDLPQLPTTSNFSQETIFRNSAHVLAIYHRKDTDGSGLP